VNVTLLPSAYAPALGGVEVLTASLAAHLKRRGHRVEVWTARTASDELLPVRETIDGILVRRFVFALPRAHPRSLLETAPAAVTTLRELRAAAREFHPDVLHVQCFSGNGAYAAALSRLMAIPLVVTLQGETLMDDHDIYEHSMTLRSSLRLGLRRAAVVTGCSEFTLNDAQKRFGLDMRRAHVIFNGVDDEVTSESVELPFERYVLGLGRVVRKKGFDLLLDAFVKLAPEQPDVGLVIAGDGPEREPLRRRVVDLGLAERVHLPGRLERYEVPAVMRGAEVFVMPSRIEPFGIVALEAWRAGVPVVVTPHGGPPEFVEDGISGLIVDPFNCIELASAMRTLLRDEKLRRELAEGGSRSYQRLTWTHITSSYEALYERITARS
jgi:glycosyltransferase involved in cell wall biosynthesis